MSFIGVGVIGLFLIVLIVIPVVYGIVQVLSTLRLARKSDVTLQCPHCQRETGVGRDECEHCRHALGSAS